MLEQNGGDGIGGVVTDGVCDRVFGIVFHNE